MGRLLRVIGCPVCNYSVEDELHEGGSGIAPMFLRNHYALAVCHDCHNLVSVLVANTGQQTQEALSEARSAITQMESDSIGDVDVRTLTRARDLLPLFRAALDTFDEAVEPAAVSTCTFCGSANIEVQRDVTAGQYDDQDAWIPCPRCEEGRLMIETHGYWD